MAGCFSVVTSSPPGAPKQLPPPWNCPLNGFQEEELMLLAKGLSLRLLARRDARVADRARSAEV